MRYEGPPSNEVMIHGLSKVAGGYECTGLEVSGYLQSGFTVKHLGSQELAVPNSAGWQPESPVTKSFAQAAGIRQWGPLVLWAILCAIILCSLKCHSITLPYVPLVITRI